MLNPPSLQPPTINPIARHNRRASWALTGLEAGAVLFAGGITLLYLNPFWHFDEGGFLDWRVHWWNTAAETLTAAGLLIGALALLACLAVILSRCVGRRSWPYAVIALLLCCALIWISPSGFMRDLDAHFEWDTADGFSVFRLQAWDEAAGAWRPIENSLLLWMVEIQLQPLLRGYFKMNDWPKMNGDVNVKVARVIPVAWPVALGSGGDTLEDPDQTALMRAVVQGDLKTVKQLLSSGTDAAVNSLDQGGQSALILACQNIKANPDVVKALIAAGANVNLRSRNGYTALTWAQARNNAEVTKLLRRAGGRP
jgi:Ankyrin repeats (3 copies)